MSPKLALAGGHQCQDYQALQGPVQRFFEERDLIPDGQFHEIRFEDLERDPLAEIRGLYEHLDIPGFEAFRPSLEEYLRSNSGYRKNEYQTLPTSLRTEISQAWRRSFDEWNYPCD